MSRIVSRISNIAQPDSEIWNLCFSEYEPEFNVDPDAVLRKVRREKEETQ